MAELKKCPFCGAKYERESGDYWYAANHAEWCLLGENPANGAALIFGDRDVGAWNRRANDG